MTIAVGGVVLPLVAPQTVKAHLVEVPVTLIGHDRKRQKITAFDAIDFACKPV
jgi:hypothetical protein